jgi:hypothetical protein
MRHSAHDFIQAEDHLVAESVQGGWLVESHCGNLTLDFKEDEFRFHFFCLSGPTDNDGPLGIH